MPNPTYHKCPFCGALLIWHPGLQGGILGHQSPFCLDFETSRPEDILARVRLQEAKDTEATTA